MVASQELFLQSGAVRDTDGISRRGASIYTSVYFASCLPSCVCVVTRSGIPSCAFYRIGHVANCDSVWRSHDVYPGAAELCTMEDTSAAQTRGKHSLVQSSNIPDNTFVCIYHQLGPCALIIYTTVTVSTILHCTNS